jgi:hypothetical protein
VAQVNSLLLDVAGDNLCLKVGGLDCEDGLRKDAEAQAI